LIINLEKRKKTRGVVAEGYSGWSLREAMPAGVGGPSVEDGVAEDEAAAEMGIALVFAS
jgi:hypothetical protein